MDTMDSRFYYPSHEVNDKMLLQDYFSQHFPYSTFKESTINMLRCLYKALSSGIVGEKTLIDISLGPIIVQLFPLCEFFEEISILKFNDASIKELKLWMDKNPEAFNWAHTSKVFQELKGISSDGCKDKEDEEEKIRVRIKKVSKWDLTEDNLADSLPLPKADCATSIWGLETISKDYEDCRKNLRKISNLIKLGNLLLYANIGSSYFKIGEDKFQLLPCDESFYREVLSEEGLEIEQFTHLEKVMCSDCTDHKNIVFIIAHKVREA